METTNDSWKICSLWFLVNQTWLSTVICESYEPFNSPSIPRIFDDQEPDSNNFYPAKGLNPGTWLE